MANDSEVETTSFNHVTDPLSREGYLGMAAYISVLIFVAFTGNILIIVAFFKSPKLRVNVHNWLLVNVAFADLAIALFGYTCTMSSGYVGGWLFGDIGCTIYGFLCFTFSQTDMNTLAILAFYRYVIVCKPQWRYKLNIRNTVYVIVLTWLYSVLWSAPPLFGWSRYVQEPFGTTCSIDWTSDIPADVAYTIILCFTCYGFHVAIMGICYLRVWQVWAHTKSSLSQSKQRIHAKSNDATRLGIFSAMKLNKRLALCSVVFIVIWAPYVFVCLWAVYDASRPGWVTTLPTMFAKSTCALNPIMYAGMNDNFREVIKEMVTAPCTREHDEITEVCSQVRCEQEKVAEDRQSV